ncbi:hypothetical protein HYQ44_019205 [Verticillium longisporum]|nr:hypothetical protein HYQ44_019205 [Verticillium longisporum]
MPPGEPVGAGAAAGRVREDETGLPLETGVLRPPDPTRSAISPLSSTTSGVKGLGWRKASSRAKRMALCVFLEMRRAGWRLSVLSWCGLVEILTQVLR